MVSILSFKPESRFEDCPGVDQEAAEVLSKDQGRVFFKR
jgi:hypothetical protein